MIIEHKVELIDCLRADHSFILQHVHAGCIVTDRQYQNLKHICLPEKTLTDLIDQVIDNGQISCSLFIEVLKNPEVVRTYPQLKDITRNLSQLCKIFFFFKYVWVCHGNDICTAVLSTSYLFFLIFCRICKKPFVLFSIKIQ
uniref:CARD domain-containing protein n=1 Tax=Scophthalmus maximus TaxID=52904 RepID=A0A8D3C2Q1_SCOMX